MSAELLKFMVECACKDIRLQDALSCKDDAFPSFDFSDSRRVVEALIVTLNNESPLSDDTTRDFQLIIACIVAYRHAAMALYQQRGCSQSTGHLGFLVGLGVAKAPTHSTYRGFYDPPYGLGLKDGQLLGMLPDVYEVALFQPRGH